MFSHERVLPVLDGSGFARPPLCKKAINLHKKVLILTKMLWKLALFVQI
jgi:hypothetical protein